MDTMRQAWARWTAAHKASRDYVLARPSEDGFPDLFGDATPEMEAELVQFLAAAGDYGKGAMAVLLRDSGAIGEDLDYVDSPAYRAGMAEERARLDAEYDARAARRADHE